MALSAANYNNCDLELTTGWGKFDLRVLPPSTIEVVVKCYMRGEAPPQGFPPGINVVDFMRDWQREVSAKWDDKIKLAGPGGEGTVKFRIEAAPLNTCHFPVLLMYGGAYGQGSGIHFPMPPAPFGADQLFLKLRGSDNGAWIEAAAQSLAGGNALSRSDMFRDSHRNIMNAANLGGGSSMQVEMQRNGNTWSVAPNDQLRLDTLCAAIAGTPPGMPQPAVRLSTTTGSQDKLTGIVNGLRQYMMGKQVQDVSIENGAVLGKRRFGGFFQRDSKLNKVHNLTKTATIEILPMANMVQKTRAGMSIADYCVSAHEFGHILGLPDEYLNYKDYSNDRMKRSQPAWHRLCDEHQPAVAKRSYDQQFNDSIMSVGTTVYPSHAVTIWKMLSVKSNQTWRITAPV